MSYGPTRSDMSAMIGWLVVGFVVMFVAVYLMFALNWLSAPATVLSPQNLAAMSRQANDRYAGLQAQLATIDQLEEKSYEYTTLYGVDMEKWPQGKRDEYQQIRAQTRNAIAAYNISCATYNALWLDEWRAIPASATGQDLPRSCELL